MHLNEEQVLRTDLQTRAEAFPNIGPANDEITLHDAVSSIKAGDKPARLDLCAGLLCAGFRQPAAINTVYDSLANAWLGDSKPRRGGQQSPTQAPTTQALTTQGTAFTSEFWSALWELVDSPGDTAAGSLSARVAALGGVLDPRFQAIAEAQSHNNPGAAKPHTRTPPAMINLAQLARAPEHSLAGHLHSMLTENVYDAEVLDRQTLGLRTLPAGLRYLNTRILQMHDVWHLAAGYRTTSLHEIAISAFQLAQFGHNYSAMFLAVVLTVASTSRPEGLPILLQIISEAWRHGRSCPALMAIEWEQEWHKPIDLIRAEQGIVVFTSALPADLFETLAQANEG